MTAQGLRDSLYKYAPPEITSNEFHTKTVFPSTKVVFCDEERIPIIQMSMIRKSELICRRCVPFLFFPGFHRRKCDLKSSGKWIRAEIGPVSDILGAIEALKM